MQSLQLTINNGIPLSLSNHSPSSVALYAILFPSSLSFLVQNAFILLFRCFLLRTCKFTVRSLSAKYFFCIKDSLYKQMDQIMVFRVTLVRRQYLYVKELNRLEKILAIDKQVRIRRNKTNQSDLFQRGTKHCIHLFIFLPSSSFLRNFPFPILRFKVSDLHPITCVTVIRFHKVNYMLLLIILVFRLHPFTFRQTVCVLQNDLRIFKYCIAHLKLFKCI